MLSGACLCGNIQYEIEGKPRFMYQCHCSMCRAGSGAPFVTNIIVDATKLRTAAGKNGLAALESSLLKFRYFCPGCGSPIYSHDEKTRHFVAVRCGTLKQDPGVRVAYHAFVSSKAAWIDISDDLPQFPEWPDPALVSRLFNAADR